MRRLPATFLFSLIRSRLAKNTPGSAHRYDECNEGLSRGNRVGPVDEGHQPADLPGQTDPLEVGDKADQPAERGGGLLGGGVRIVR